LDIEVSKLKILKSGHQSQIYRLQDHIMQILPLQIESTKNAIERNKADIEMVNANTHKGEKGISPMTIGDKTYTDRGKAGEALRESRKSIIGLGPDKVGSYRGMDIEISFDPLKKEYNLHLEGRTKHKVSMGDSAGNITRLDNIIDKIPENLQKAEIKLEDLLHQLENAKAALEAPFPQEAEYQEKIAELAEVEAKLNADNAPQAVDEAKRDDIETPAVQNERQSTKVTAKESTTALFDRLNEPDKGTSGPNPKIPAVSNIKTPPVKPHKSDDAR